MKRFSVQILGAALGLSVLAACSSSGGGSSPAPPAPPAATHLYVPFPNAVTSKLLVYTLPLTTGATPSVTVASAPANTYAVLADSANNRLFAGVQNGIAVYTLPITSSSTPSYTIPVASSYNAQMAFDAAGNLYVADRLGAIRVFAPPFSAASTPTVVHGGYANVYGLAISGSTLYAVDDSARVVYAYALPFTASSTPTVTLNGANGLSGPFGVGIDSGGRLVVADNSNQYFFALPLTAGSLPLFGVSNGVNSATCAVFDASNNMYSDNFGNNTITVYAPPFSAASTATVSVSMTSAPYCPSIGI